MSLFAVLTREIYMAKLVTKKNLSHKRCVNFNTKTKISITFPLADEFAFKTDFRNDLKIKCALYSKEYSVCTVYHAPNETSLTFLEPC